jgi:hypothetical protein
LNEVTKSQKKKTKNHTPNLIAARLSASALALFASIASRVARLVLTTCFAACYSCGISGDDETLPP